MSHGQRRKIIIVNGLGSKRLKQIVEGYSGDAPVLMRGIESTIRVIRRDGTPLLVIDRECTNVDILELILNIEDVDANIPIVVVGKSGNKPEDSAIEQRDTVTVVNDDGELKEVLQNVLA